MKAINVLIFFIMGLVNVYAQSDSILINGLLRPIFIKEEMESINSNYYISIEITDAIRLDSIAKQAYLAKQAPKDTTKELVFSCPSEIEIGSQNYMYNMPPFDGIKYVVLDVLQHKYPNLIELMDGGNIVTSISIDMEGVLYRLIFSTPKKHIADLLKDSMKDMLQKLNLIYRFEKPSKYNMYQPAAYSFSIRPEDREKLIGKP